MPTIDKQLVLSGIRILSTPAPLVVLGVVIGIPASLSRPVVRTIMLKSLFCVSAVGEWRILALRTGIAGKEANVNARREVGGGSRGGGWMQVSLGLRCGVFDAALVLDYPWLR